MNNSTHNKKENLTDLFIIYTLFISILLFKAILNLLEIFSYGILKKEVLTEKSKIGPKLSLVEGVIPNIIYSNVNYSGFIVKYDNN